MGRKIERGNRAQAARCRGCRPHDAQARHGQGELRHDPGHERAHPALRRPRRHRRGRVRGLQALRPRRHPRRKGNLVQDQDRRALGKSDGPAPAREGAAASAGEIPRARRPGAEVPPALRGPHHERGDARRVPDAQPHRARDPGIHDRQGFLGGRDADDAADPRRREREAVQDASQRARRGAFPASRARALPQAPRGGRIRKGVRDQPELQERRHLDAAQPRVHHARVLRSLPRLPLPHGFQRGDAALAGKDGAGSDDPALRRAYDRVGKTVRAPHDRPDPPKIRTRVCEDG